MKKQPELTNKTIVISRTDSIGDVALTLPMCVWIKQHYPTSRVIFLANRYTEPVLACLPQIDEIIIWSELEQKAEQEQIAYLKSKQIDIFIHVFPKRAIASLAKKAGIPVRVGTLNRLYHFFTCNIKPHFSRVKSDLHEAQLNFNLLKPFGLTTLPSLNELGAFMRTFKPTISLLPELIQSRLIPDQKKVILHPKSQGSAREWPIENYIQLANALLNKGYLVIFSGTEKEGLLFRQHLPHHQNCIDTTGKLTLSELILLISQCDALVACSTGPLHLAGILGINAVGLYAPRKPIHPGRWQPLGENVHILVNNKECELCKKQQSCQCIEQIAYKRVLEQLV